MRGAFKVKSGANLEALFGDVLHPEKNRIKGLNFAIRRPAQGSDSDVTGGVGGGLWRGDRGVGERGRVKSLSRRVKLVTSFNKIIYSLH